MKDQRNVIEYHTLANMLQAQDGMITQLEQWSLNWVGEMKSERVLDPCIVLEPKNEKCLFLKAVSKVTYI